MVVSNLTTDRIMLGTSKVTRLYFGSQYVWEHNPKDPPGHKIFDSSGTFIVPDGYDQVALCMVGGGGSGACRTIASGGLIGGGHAGQVVSMIVNGLVEGQEIDFVIGSGGASVNSTSHGNSGSSTSFGAITAAGGTGGLNDTSSFGGNNQEISTCGGVGYNGDYTIYTEEEETWQCYGGESSGFGDGGDSNALYGDSAYPGGIGSGGGAVGAGGTSGAGGRGEIYVEWGGPGNKAVTATETFVVPSAYGAVTLCMLGGGGSGAAGKLDVRTDEGGGDAGYLNTDLIEGLTGGEEILVTIGAGGTGVSRLNSGNPGGATTFGSYATANGGHGGIHGDPTDWDGGTVNNCAGSNTNGIKKIYDNGDVISIIAGGQSSGIGKGGDAGADPYEFGEDGGTAAGGGATDSATSGKGGNGYCHITWGAIVKIG